MLIIGAGGCAKDLLAMLELEDDVPQVCLYDDVTPDVPDLLFDRYPVLKRPDAAIEYFRLTDARFVLGVGVPQVRSQLISRFEELGGRAPSLVSQHARVGSFSSVSDRGVLIMHDAILTQDVEVREGSLINMRCTLGHGCRVGRFCDLAPGVYASSCLIGDFCHLGISSVLKPGIRLGNNVTVGAGSVVTHDVSDNQIVAGVPARPIGVNSDPECTR